MFAVATQLHSKRQQNDPFMIEIIKLDMDSELSVSDTWFISALMAEFEPARKERNIIAEIFWVLDVLTRIAEKYSEGGRCTEISSFRPK